MYDDENPHLSLLVYFSLVGFLPDRYHIFFPFFFDVLVVYSFIIYKISCKHFFSQNGGSEAHGTNVPI